MEIRRWKGAVILIAALSAAKADRGYDGVPSISQMSPKSVNEDVKKESDAEELLISSEMSAQFVYSDLLESTRPNGIDKDSDIGPHVILARSAEPILNTDRMYDDLLSSKNIENSFDMNDIEVHNVRKYYEPIEPTKTLPGSTWEGDSAISASGEDQGVPRGRALPLAGPLMTSASAPTATLTLGGEQAPRQAEPDIKDIITGIVKLLKGNVNVQVDTQPSRPPRPVATRINNRGPPRISDVPLPPDFDPPEAPLMPPLPTKMPPPYPFDRPPIQRPFLNGVPLPEQIVPLGANHYRPGFHGNRPISYPPWQRPRPRPNPNRRPNPNLPMYKPMPPMGHEDVLTFSNHDESYTTIPMREVPIRRPEEFYDDTTDSDSAEDVVEMPTPGNGLEPNLSTLPNYDSTGGENSLTTVISVENSTETTTSTSTSTTTTTTAKPEPEMEKIEILTKLEIMKDKDYDRKKGTSFASDKDKTIPVKTKQDRVTPESKPALNEIKTEIPKEQRRKTTTNTPAVVTKPLTTSSAPIIEGSIPEKATTASTSSITPSLSTIQTPTEGLPSFVSTKNVTPATKDTATVSTIKIEPSTTTPHPGFPYFPYKPRPGIVLDDTDFKPHGKHKGSQASSATSNDVPVITADRPHLGGGGGYGEIFDVTVSAIQGPGGGSLGSATVHIENVHPVTGHSSAEQERDIIVSASGEHGFVSIDGKRTYLNLFGDSTESSSLAPTRVTKTTNSVAATPVVTGSGVAIPAPDMSIEPSVLHGPTRAGTSRPAQPHPRPQQAVRRPTGVPRKPQPTVRIDTCIVGDDSTCDQTQNERCKTEGGISSCQCRPGYARRKHRDPCRKIIAMVMSLRVDRIYDRKIVWTDKLGDRESEPFHQLSYETLKAIDSAFSMTPYSDEYVGGAVNSVYNGDPAEGNQGVFVNVTVLLEEGAMTIVGGAVDPNGGSNPRVGGDVQRHLVGVISRRRNNVGESAVWVDTPAGSIASLKDLDECSSSDLNDCHSSATCINTWGGFRCVCPTWSRDEWLGRGPSREGRDCTVCPTDHCSSRGTCQYTPQGQLHCNCQSGYYGSQCEVDGEVVGVAVGATLAALLVIIVTLVCLVTWSRRWSREQKSTGMGSPVFGYTGGGAVKTPSMGQPPYQLTLEERMRWAQLADVMAQANHYAPEPLTMTRPSSAMYGAYPTLQQGLAPPVPLPRTMLRGASVATGSLRQHTVTSRANGGPGNQSVYGGLAGFLSTQHAAAAAAANATANGSDYTSSSSASSGVHQQDRADLLGGMGGMGGPGNGSRGPYHVPRPKSRSNTINSIANQSGIYYDVDYENTPDPIYGTKGIPLSTYTVSRGGPPFYRC